ncbi:MAG: hypothetical protein DRQ10_05745 [Candidatus Hydrothermota bacterium]|nr:MAG: hypothetical protein DRQ10_05745 [Candidatus Hydrothermae bacterium]
MEQLLLIAIKIEIDSEEVHRNLAERVKNYLLKNRLLFPADEGEKHRAHLESIYVGEFGNKLIELSPTSEVALPTISSMSNISCGEHLLIGERIVFYPCG